PTRKRSLATACATIGNEPSDGRLASARVAGKRSRPDTKKPPRFAEVFLCARGARTDARKSAILAGIVFRAGLVGGGRRLAFAAGGDRRADLRRHAGHLTLRRGGRGGGGSGGGEGTTRGGGHARRGA